MMADDAADAATWIERAAAHRREGRVNEALRAYQAAVAADPRSADAHAHLAAFHVGLGQLDEAEAGWRRIVALDPALPGAHNNLGSTLRSLGRREEAREAFETALRLQPVYAEASNNLAATLCELGRFEEALPLYMAAIRARPNYPKALCNMGSALRDMRRFDDALACLYQALQLAPDFPEAHAILSELLLVTGQFEAAWPEYEWRLLLPGVEARRLHAPAWGGGATGKTILVHAEGGLGDTIQFCRYVPRLAAAGHRIVMEVPRALRRLLAGLPGAEAVVAAGDPLPPHDLHCPIMSLPFATRTTLATVPADVPYLSAAPTATARWAARLAALPGRKVGLVWAGNPAYAADARRSIPLARLAPLAAARDATFVSLQKGPPARDEAPDGLVLHDWTDGLADMADTAALIAALDLVIGVDTAVVHLAGALGKPVWLLNRFDTEWRWLLDREDSPWYPTLRLFRQPALGDWDTPVAAARDALDGAAAAPRPVAAPARDLVAAQRLQQVATFDRLAAHAMRAGAFDAALAHSREAVGLRPDLPWLHNNLANALRVLGRLDEALAAYEASLALAEDVAVRCNVGHVLMDMGRFDAAEAAYRAAIEARPDFAEAHSALGGVLLTTGRLTEGWEAFRWRTRVGTFVERPFEQPLWDGAKRPGQTVLLHSDEGLGDAIQCARFIARAASVTRVVLEIPPPLAPLLANMPGVAGTVIRGEPLPPFDAHCPLLDLPRLFCVTLGGIPRQTPYLFVDPERAAFWRARLAGVRGLRVGLVWSGNPLNPIDRIRSIPPRLLHPLVTRMRGCGFVSLQRDNDRVGMTIPGTDTVHDWTDELHDMGETAALIMALDLVIGVDTAVIHLAGALGRPAWLMNRLNTDWRWLLHRSDSPWYPTVRIFRQPRLGEWEKTIDAVGAALEDLAAGARVAGNIV